MRWLMSDPFLSVPTQQPNPTSCEAESHLHYQTDPCLNLVQTISASGLSTPGNQTMQVDAPSATWLSATAVVDFSGILAHSSVTTASDWPLTCQQQQLRGHCDELQTERAVISRSHSSSSGHYTAAEGDFCQARQARVPRVSDPMMEFDTDFLAPIDTSTGDRPWSRQLDVSSESQRSELISSVTSLGSFISSPEPVQSSLAPESARKTSFSAQQASLRQDSRQSSNQSSRRESYQSDKKSSSQSERSSGGRRKTSRELVEEKDPDLARLIDDFLEIEQTTSSAGSSSSLRVTSGGDMMTFGATQQAHMTTAPLTSAISSLENWHQQAMMCSSNPFPLTHSPDQVHCAGPGELSVLRSEQAEPSIKQESHSPDSFAFKPPLLSSQYQAPYDHSPFLSQIEEPRGYVARETEHSQASALSSSAQNKVFSQESTPQLQEFPQHLVNSSQSTGLSSTTVPHRGFLQHQRSVAPQQSQLYPPSCQSSDMFLLSGAPGSSAHFGYYYGAPSHYYHGAFPVPASPIFGFPTSSRFRKPPSLAAHPDFLRAVSSPEMEYPPGFLFPPPTGVSRSYPNLEPLHSVAAAVTAAGQSLSASGYGLPLPQKHQSMIRTFSDTSHFTGEGLEPQSPMSSSSTRLSEPMSSRRSSQGAASNTSSRGSPSPNTGPLSPACHGAGVSLFQPVAEAAGPSSSHHPVGAAELLYLTTVAASQARQAAAMGEQKVCAVCGDNASCAHYGVRTCEGCKGFFKRTVQKNAQYVCMGSKDCPIDKRRRNRCQYCRYQKCLIVGMVKEVVRHGSLRGRRGRLPSKTKAVGPDDPPSPTMPLVTLLARAYIESKPVARAEGSAGPIWSDDASGVINSESWLKLLNLSLEAIRAWAERIPGFTDLPLTDQEILFEHNFFNVLALRIAYRSVEVAMDGHLIMDDSNVYTINQFQDAWQPFFAVTLTEAQHMKELIELDLQGFSCLCALALLHPADGVPLEDSGKADQLRSRIVNALKDHCTSGSTKPTDHFSLLLNRVQETQKGIEALRAYTSANLKFSVRLMASPRDKQSF